MHHHIYYKAASKKPRKATASKYSETCLIRTSGGLSKTVRFSEVSSLSRLIAFSSIYCKWLMLFSGYEDKNWMYKLSDICEQFSIILCIIRSFKTQIKHIFFCSLYCTSLYQTRYKDVSSFLFQNVRHSAFEIDLLTFKLIDHYLLWLIWPYQTSLIQLFFFLKPMFLYSDIANWIVKVHYSQN